MTVNMQIKPVTPNIDPNVIFKKSLLFGNDFKKRNANNNPTTLFTNALKEIKKKVFTPLKFFFQRTLLKENNKIDRIM